MKKEPTHHLHLPCLLLFLLSLLRPITSDPRARSVKITCSPQLEHNETVFVPNFVASMEKISQVVQTTGFGTAQTGSGPDGNYALAQCYGDLPLNDCVLCYAEARTILPKCYPQNGGRIFLDGCFMRAENYSFYKEFKGPEDTVICGNTTKRNNATFGDAVRQVVRNAVAAAPGSGGYARGASENGESAFALVNCWRNLSPESCKQCLEDASASMVDKCLPWSEGRALHTGCFLRYSDQDFLNKIPRNGRSRGSVVVIVVSVFSSVIVFMVGIAIGVYICKHRTIQKKRRGSNDVEKMAKTLTDSSLNFKYSTLEKATGSFDNANKLGQGGFGTVYKGVLADGRDIAVKRLFFNNRHRAADFYNEVNIISSVEHKNLVRLLGCSCSGPESLLVYEYLQNKSLDRFIFDVNRGKTLDWQRRFVIIVGTAEGLVYLHEQSSVKIIHRDIKASNILLDCKLQAKIADFGLARSFQEDKSHISTAIAGTLGYMAPEYLAHGQLTEKVDVYSFGVLVLEIVTGKQNTKSKMSDYSDSLITEVSLNHFIVVSDFTFLDLTCVSRFGLLKKRHVSIWNFFLHDSPFKKRRELYQGVLYNVIKRFQSRLPESSGKELEDSHDPNKTPNSSSSSSSLENRRGVESGIESDSSGDEDTGDGKWKLDLAWLTKALEPASQLRRWALPTGERSQPGNRSLSEIIASIQKSKLGIEGWTLGDLTIGLYLIYLRQASLSPFEDVKGVQVVSESTVSDLIYNAELAKGCYRDSVSGLAKNTMLRENNILKFVKDSSVMRPGYYVGVDHRRKLVVFGIRGTHTIYDIITDIVSSSDDEVTFEGYSTHFGTAEAARWFLNHELQTMRRCLERYEGYKLRLVGHSLGGAIASLMAIMLRKMPRKELGFDAEIISAVGYATPPCVSRELAENCSEFVTTIVMQDDIIPRLSQASLARLRDEILQTDWTSVIEKEEWKSVLDLVTNAKQVVSSVQDAARKVSEYAKFGNKTEFPELPSSKNHQSDSLSTETTTKDVVKLPEELYVPGAVYYLMRNVRGNTKSSAGKKVEYFSLWKRDPGQHFQRILLSGNFITDHKCDSHYYALRDVLKGFPGFIDESIFNKRSK